MKFCYCCNATPEEYEVPGASVAVMLCVSCFRRHYMYMGDKGIVGCREVASDRAYWIGWSTPSEVTKVKNYFDTLTAPKGRAEKPCIVCKRPNDLGVLTCWWCGELRPTRANAKEA